MKFITRDGKEIEIPKNIYNKHNRKKRMKTESHKKEKSPKQAPKVQGKQDYLRLIEVSDYVKYRIIGCYKIEPIIDINKGKCSRE